MSDPGSERTEPKRVGEGLDRLARSLSGVGAQPLATVFTEWQAVVGDTLAAHCRPLALDGTRLVIGVDEPAWATQVRFLETELLARLAEVVTTAQVRSIEVRVTPSPAAVARSRKAR